MTDIEQFQKLINSTSLKFIKLRTTEFNKGVVNRMFISVKLLGIDFLVMKSDIKHCRKQLGLLELYYRIDNQAVHIANYSRICNNRDKFGDLEKVIKNWAKTMI